MTVEDLLVYGNSLIHKDLTKILLGDLLNLNPLELLIHLNDEVSQEKVELYKKEVQAVKDNKPIQYVLGYSNFYGQKFLINENVLIPRFETEELVAKTLEYIEEYFPSDISILDIGCGSGVIGLTLKNKLPKAQVTLLDISREALEVAKKNATNLGLSTNFVEKDFLENHLEKYDVIISNPPYIGTKEEIEEIVLENEPALALFAGSDGLDCYRKILKNIRKNLNSKFLIAFEIGAEQAEAIKNLAEEYLDDIEIVIKKDLQKRNRMIFIFSNNLIK